MSFTGQLWRIETIYSPSVPFPKGHGGKLNSCVVKNPLLMIGIPNVASLR